MAKRTLLILIALAALFTPEAAQACSCDERSPCSTFWTADVVFIGRAQSAVSKTRGHQETRFVVEEWLRGEKVGSELTTISRGIGGSCDYGLFDQGTRYLVHANKRPDGTWGVFLCGGTALLAQATNDLKYIRESLAHPGPGNVRGIAILNIDQGERKLSRPVADARVVLRSSSEEKTTRTDKEGIFRFEAVPAGDYTLMVEATAASQAVKPKRIAVGRDACAHQSLFTIRR
jgi:hypothetical protein